MVSVPGPRISPLLSFPVRGVYACREHGRLEPTDVTVGKPRHLIYASSAGVSPTLVWCRGSLKLLFCLVFGLGLTCSACLFLNLSSPGFVGRGASIACCPDALGLACCVCTTFPGMFWLIDAAGRPIACCFRRFGPASLLSGSLPKTKKKKFFVLLD